MKYKYEGTLNTLIVFTTYTVTTTVAKSINCIAQKFDEERLWQMVNGWNFGEQNFDELIIGFIGKTLREKG